MSMRIDAQPACSAYNVSRLASLCRPCSVGAYVCLLHCFIPQNSMVCGLQKTAVTKVASRTSKNFSASNAAPQALEAKNTHGPTKGILEQAMFTNWRFNRLVLLSFRFDYGSRFEEGNLHCLLEFEDQAVARHWH